MRARRLIAVSWCAVALAVPRPAHALAPQQVLVTANGYVLSEIVILQGDTLSLTNVDPNQPHDLVSRNRPGGVYAFRADVIDFGKQTDVVGTSVLTPNVYPFYCSVHEWMIGNLTVEAVA